MSMARLRRIVNSMGGHIQSDRFGNYYHCYVHAPPRKIWIACLSKNQHYLYINWNIMHKEERTEAITRAIEQVTDGVDECSRHKCPYCKKHKTS